MIFNSGIDASVLSWCFRHQVLLGCHRHFPGNRTDRRGRVEEREYDFPRRTKSTLEEKISPNVSRLRVRPACKAGVLVRS